MDEQPKSPGSGATNENIPEKDKGPPAKADIGLLQTIETALCAQFRFLSPVTLFLKQEWKVLKAARRISFLIAICVAWLTWSAGSCYHRTSIEAQNKEITSLRLDKERLESVIGATDLANKTTFMKLTNSELKRLGTRVCQRIRQMNKFYAENLAAHKRQFTIGEIPKERCDELTRQEQENWADEYERGLRRDTEIAHRELQNRIPISARKHLAGLINITINPADRRASPVELMPTAPNRIAVALADEYAKQIEELVKLLPD